MHRATVSAPAMFGRLPDQRDYVRWRVSAGEGQVWQAWLNRQTWVGSGRHIVLPEGQTADEERDGWMHLSPRGEHDMPAPEHHPLPWSFVLSPGFLPVGGANDWLTGVLTASRDSVGRPWPLVIYQRASREWLEEGLAETQGWLYWLARLAAQHTSPDAARHARLTEQVDRLWAMWQPGPWWGAWLRGLRRVPQRSRELSGLPDDIPAVELPGVRHLPWPGWPGKVLAQAPSGQGWFWQQNIEGRYVDALRLSEERK
ncbi:TagF domain-containing protein [Enterobacter sp.]|uniref:TagF domain-containing protein n=1 Tax=Enterobacter sp. TaxID=42895 RepID=UPI00296F35FF|nr:TagF domain-containing protein [Enterobacter sp.]